MRCPYIPIFQNKNYLNKLNTCNIGVKLTNDTLLRKKANILENNVAELYNYLKIRYYYVYLSITCICNLVC